MRAKTPAQMDRSELIGMVTVLQRQLDELTSPENIRLYQLGKLTALAREQVEPAPPEPFWKRLLPRRAA
jgi:hypothetical protein